MTIAAAATEARATELLTECRRCLLIGAPLTGIYLQWVIDQLESVTVNNVTARTNVTPDHQRDGRNTAEAAIVDAA